MLSLTASKQLIKTIADSETGYMEDRMLAIQGRASNPEGVELRRFGNAICLYSRTMPWPSFNTVKGLTSEDAQHVDAILQFYRERNRKLNFEIVPGLVDQSLLELLAERGFYQSGFHTSMYIDPHKRTFVPNDNIRIEELQEDQFALYARIHCRGTGLPDDGIPHVAANNRVLYQRHGWKFYIGYVEEQPAAAGVMFMKNGIASLTFAATLPEHRNKGLQLGLLYRRLEEAQTNDCRLAVGQCAFLSQSHRNMERVGMETGYVRTTWTER